MEPCSENTCAVPVLPAARYGAPRNTLYAVPDGFSITFSIPRFTTSMSACLSGIVSLSFGTVRRRPRVIGSSTSFTR
ncbi:hypothetical protein BGI28_29130 [Burkholderia contaminans]|nr:hypothetical protein BGI28_29130 [Burkholderia contaminans]